MKKILMILSICTVANINAATLPQTNIPYSNGIKVIATQSISDSSPAVAQLLCIAGYKFAVIRQFVYNSTSGGNGYAGASSNMVEVSDQNNKPIKCD